jgi:ankyrin repeat protein
MFKAAEEGDAEQLRLALTPENVDDVIDYSWTALHRATYSGSVECVNVCLEMGADVNRWEKLSCWTPLHIASKRKFVDITRILSDAGASVDPIDTDGRTPLHYVLRIQGSTRVDLRNNRFKIAQLDTHLPHYTCRQHHPNQLPF